MYNDSVKIFYRDIFTVHEGTVIPARQLPRFLVYGRDITTYMCAVHTAASSATVRFTFIPVRFHTRHREDMGIELA